ncbi:TrmH family RNA methyltransferase [Luteococcus japonicus]|uniref:TrmH family RNA methyltransferase n=1 Tax=Luteococcus japonicus TaxID=33984 RepID=A0A3N1ZYC6_9ACTN|nr:RNA methyltransferase [Luteococcus japonicus]ROR55836.1 TrmH family RNA methyltransferase [Luteococcus japonicus]
MTFDEPSALPLISRGQQRSARRLLSRRERDEQGLFLAEGAQAVREALRRPDLVEAVIVDDEHIHAELLGMADPQICWKAHPDDMFQLSDTVTPQGVVAIVRQELASLDDIVAPKLVVVCAQVRDPGNAGTVIRCADAFGADAVVFTKGSVEVFNPKTVRATVGSIFHLPIVVGVEIADAVTWLHQQGMQVFAADGGGVHLDELDGDLARPTAWIMGNEAWGLPERERGLADKVVGVPMWGQAESLNLSTAAAVCLYATASAQRSATD